MARSKVKINTELSVVEREASSAEQTVHPGWVRATDILMRGLERREARLNDHAKDPGRSKRPDA